MENRSRVVSFYKYFTIQILSTYYKYTFINQIVDIALIKNNAKVAADIAVELARLDGSPKNFQVENDVKNRPVSA